MNLPKTTNKQQAILQLLYRYRFLNRIQIQTLMGHKDYKTINVWLKNLREKNYIAWIYSTHFAEKTKPAIYYLSLNGVRHLRSLADEEGTPTYPTAELHKRYKEANRQPDFIARSILVADCCINMATKNTTRLQYSFVLLADYIDPDNEYHFLAEHETLRPALYFVKQEQTKQGEVTTNYLLDIFDASLPRYRMKKRIKLYLQYLEDDEWEGTEPRPIVLLACANLNDMIYAKRLTKRLLEDIYEEDVHIRFSTTAKIQELGMTGRIWEEVTRPED